MSCNLQGIGILVTRPSGQGEALCGLITENGGRAIHFPTISIGPAEDPVVARGLLQKIADYHIVIFISSNAVKYGLEFMRPNAIPPELIKCAVGKRTAQTLEENGITVDVKPDGSFDSESLLAVPGLNKVAGKRVLILRGNGGRRLLGDTLRERGAEVDYAEVYSRSIASTDSGPLLDAWEKEIDIATATSREVLENLVSLLGEAGHAMFCKTPLVVVSERVKVRAEELGCSSVILADEASDQGLLSAICKWSGVTSR